MAVTLYSVLREQTAGSSGFEVNIEKMNEDGVAVGDSVVLKDTGGSALTGTLASTGTAVTGTTTAFDTELEVGQFIEAGGELREVTDIADATNLTVNAAFSPDLSGATATLATDYGKFTVKELRPFHNTLYIEESVKVQQDPAVHEVKPIA
tara:strand:+ start:20647 stop:21099 length:453 start_codon:yes stop_codon:yes gene_type:complete